MSYNGITLGFQPKDAGSIPVTRSSQILGSSVVEQMTVNHPVAGSNPARGANLLENDYWCWDKEISHKICKKLINIGSKNIKIGKNVKIEFVKDRPGHDIRYALNSNKLMKELNWKPKTNLFDGLNSTFKWYLNNLNYYSSIKAKDATKRVGLKK